MIAETHLAAYNAVVFDNDASTDACLRRNHHTLSDVTVVSHVDHVVDLRTAANARPTKRSAIDASICSQFDVIFD